MKIILRAFMVVFSVLIILIVMFVNYFFWSKQNYDNTVVELKRGDTILTVYNKLGLEFNVFDKIYSKFDPRISKINMGLYRFNGEFSRYDIINKIKNDDIDTVRLTIPEGFTSRQVFNRITELGLGTQQDIIEALENVEFPYPHEENNYEGYFYPETYIFSPNESTQVVIQTILDQFIKEFPVEEYGSDKNFYNNLILASIVEAEVIDNIDKEEVAKIFLKRLNINMRLESDATLKYELGRQATARELREMTTPYNSYRIKGLPPTPIGNPSKDTFLIVEKVKNDDTDNLFFFTHKGKTYYSSTHDEHLRKRRETGQMR